MDISALANNGQTGTTENDRTTLGGNFDTFLKLLTTQLKNQNPLDPIDATQFTDQLVKYASVEQQIKTNRQLETMLQANAAANTAGLASYLGTTIEASGTEAQLGENGAKWKLQVSEPVREANITIRDANGHIIHEARRSLERGDNIFIWDGEDTGGNPYPAGAYRISVEAINDAGNTVPVTSIVSGKVTGIDFTADPVALQVGDISISLAQLLSVNA